MTGNGRIAAIINDGTSDNQDLLTRSAAAWSRLGDRIVGVIAEQLDEESQACSAGFLRDIVSDRRLAIYLEQPPTGTTCHLDIDGVEAAGGQLLAQIPASDIVVLSKFGKLEAAGQGLWSAFQAAREAGKLVVTTVSPKHVDAWMKFAPAAIWLQADVASLDTWRRSAIS